MGGQDSGEAHPVITALVIRVKTGITTSNVKPDSY